MTNVQEKCKKREYRPKVLVLKLVYQEPCPINLFIECLSSHKD